MRTAVRSLWSLSSRWLHADAALFVWVAALVAMLVVPMPTALLDLLIASNLAISVLLMLVSLSARDGLAFSAMPTLLLITTLFRLSLNVSSTRLILLQADAGEVIAAFGEFVVRGDYAVGAVILLVLTIVQYVVVARGAERVAEVGARFSLDALPGKQLAIEADVRAGGLSAARAAEQRRQLERESRFYGAMDGAMKFVKGDAIAGIAIAAVGFIAGSAIGSLRDGMALGESLRVYGLLTIGDALVSQIPSLLVATGAGLVVTRVASSEPTATLGGDVGRQLLGDARVLWTATALFALLALVPGLPAAPFGVLAIGLSLLGLRAHGDTATGRPPLSAGTHATDTRVELGGELFDACDVSHLQDVALRLRRAFGVPRHAPGIERAPALPVRGYRIVVLGAVADHGELAAEQAPNAALAERLERCLRVHAGDLLGVDEAQALLDELARQAPVLVQTLVPQVLSLRALTRVLAGLAAEGVPLHPLRPVLEAIAAECSPGQEPQELIERTRRRVARQLVAAIAPSGVLGAHPIDPMIEDALREAVQGRGEQAYLALAPDLASDILASVRASVMESTAPPSVLLTQPDVRRWLRSLIASELPLVPVLSYAELPAELRIEQRAPVRAGRSPAAQS